MRLAAASAELKSNPSEPAVSMASDMKEPALAAIAEVTTTCCQTAAAGPGMKVVIVVPLGGRVEYVSVLSAHVLSATFLMMCSLFDSLITGDASDCRSAVRPKLAPGWSLAT